MHHLSLPLVTCTLALSSACGAPSASGPTDGGESGDPSSDTAASGTDEDGTNEDGTDEDGSSTETGEPEPEPRPAWYAGDLHLHSSYSLDALDNPVAEVRDLAESLGLDYFVFTDHDNHVDGDIQTWADPEYASDSMIMLYGVEYTTARGHANLFAPAPWDHLQLWALRDDQGDGSVILDKGRELGVHFSVNHPSNGDPWEFDINLDYDSVEVWNAMWRVPASNPATLTLWDQLLLEGRHLTGRGGSDCHHQDTFEANLLNVGNPTTWIAADEPTAEALLAGLKQGRASISYSPLGERIDLWADPDGDGRFDATVGDEVSPTAGLRLRLDIEGFRADAPYTLVVVHDGITDAPIPIDAASTTFELPEIPTRYVRVELHGDVPFAVASEADAAILYGDMIALSNPIYIAD